MARFTIQGEPYFKYWRIRFIENWGGSMVRVYNGGVFGREGGPELLAEADYYQVSPGASFDYVTFEAPFDPENPPYLIGVWRYPIAPRMFLFENDGGEDAAKRFLIEVSNNLREWFTIADEEIAQGEPSLLCPMFSDASVISHGRDQNEALGDCEYDRPGADVALTDCDMAVLYMSGTGNDGVAIRIRTPEGETARIKAKFYDGEWPDIVLSETHTDLMVNESGSNFYLNNDNSFIQRFATLAIVPYDSTEPVNLLVSFGAICS